MTNLEQLHRTNQALLQKVQSLSHENKGLRRLVTQLLLVFEGKLAVERRDVPQKEYA